MYRSFVHNVMRGFNLRVPWPVGTSHDLQRRLGINTESGNCAVVNRPGFPGDYTC